MSEDGHDWTALVLAGGRSTRLGQDKTRAVVGDRTLLEHVAGAIPHDVTCIVVGPPPATTSRVLVVAIEDEPDGGPVAGVDCGIAFVSTPVVVVLAADMPFAPAIADRLLVELDGADPTVDAVVPVDSSGRRQPLAAAYRTGPLREALADLAPVRGRSMHQLLERLRVLELSVDDADETLLLDIDTAADLERARRTVTDTDSETEGTRP
jgi:molybdopterin-guanine dinucleotide biosynthesis protein A